MTWLQAWATEDWLGMAGLLNLSPRSVLPEPGVSETDRRVYLHINPSRGKQRQIARQQDVNDGSVTVAWLDLDATGNPIGLELILMENPQRVLST